MAIAPHGGRLTQIREEGVHAQHFSGFSDGQKVSLTKESVTTTHNIACGILSPLEGFMGEGDLESVLDDMRLKNDLPWTIPTLLLADSTSVPRAGGEVLLVDEAGRPVAVMAMEETFKIPKDRFVEKVYGTNDAAHPGVAKVLAGPGTAIAGRLLTVAKPDFGPFEEVTLRPKETRVLFSERRWKTVVAFQTRNAPHINHEYLQKSALALVDGLFVNPVLGKKKAGDFKDEVILATYKAIMTNYYPKSSVVMSVLHYEMQYAGPKEAIMHAIMRKNFGCTHIIIGRDHAGVGNYYGPYAAQEIFKEFPDLGMTPLFFKEFYYCKKCAGIASEKTCPHGDEDKLSFSGTKLRKMFSEGEVPPKEFMRPEVAQAILKFEHPFVE